jgi:hypothetical protein
VNRDGAKDAKEIRRVVVPASNRDRIEIKELNYDQRR